MARIHSLPFVETITAAPLYAKQTSVWQKRSLDIAISCATLLLCLPICLIIFCAIRGTSRGPALFKQTRTGQGGRAFTIYKFRTLYCQSPDNDRQVRQNDARVTSVGRFLRQTSLDELPQLWNVLRGDMSIVGPRPHALAHDAYYGARIPTYYRRFRMKPGLTGLAQIRDFRGETADLAAMEGRIHLDLVYINTWSLWSDIDIIARTPGALIRTTRAY
ncbi:MAG: sugar transferase [Pseudomonadota bacterium]